MNPSMFFPDASPIVGLTFGESNRLTGDSTNQVVTWQGRSDISGIGEVIAIRVKVFQAKLFAYQV